MAGSVGVAFSAAFELKTGGFFKNIISYNVNPFAIQNAIAHALPERNSLPFILVMLVSVVGIGRRFVREDGWAALGHRDRCAIAEIVVGAHFVLACVSALEIVKDGGSNNYFIDMLTIGCVLIGLWLHTLMVRPVLLSAIIIVLAMATAMFHPRFLAAGELARVAALRAPLVEQIAAASKPVTSDDMVLIMRAGKSLIFEPAIVSVLVAQEKWDPAPLLAMIRDHGFAFALTNTDGSVSGPVVTQALTAAYPREEPIDTSFIAHYPPANEQPR